MTASIKEREDKLLCDREDYVEDTKKLSLKQRKNQLNQSLRKHWKERERNWSLTAYRLKRTKICIVSDRDALMDKEQRLPSALKNCGEQEEAIAETASASR